MAARRAFHLAIALALVPKQNVICPHLASLLVEAITRGIIWQSQADVPDSHWGCCLCFVGVASLISKLRKNIFFIIIASNHPPPQLPASDVLIIKSAVTFFKATSICDKVTDLNFNLFHSTSNLLKLMG